MTVSLASLMTAETKATIYAKGLLLATTLGLPVTSWQTGDPTRSLYHHLAEVLSNLESRIVGFIQAGFLDYAGATEPASSWLVLLADQVYGYTADEATSATPTITLSNAGGGEYPFAVGEVVARSSVSGKTFHNTSTGVLGSGPLSCTFQDAGDTVTRNGHGLANGDAIQFVAITTTTGISTLTTYYVVNQAANTFQVSATIGGAALPLTTNGTGTYGSVLELDMVADEAGAESSVAVDEVDELVTTFLGVSIAASTAASATDAESAASIVLGCRAKLGALSPNGPADAYESVATDATKTGTTAITKATVVADSATGDVTIYVAGPSGGVAAGDVNDAQDAIETWATPLCITPTVVTASAVTVAVTYSKKVRSGIGKTVAEIEDTDEEALQALFAALAIGGDGGFLYHSLLEATLQGADPDHCYEVAVATPAGNTALTASQVAVLGVITPTVTIDP